MVLDPVAVYSEGREDHIEICQGKSWISMEDP